MTSYPLCAEERAKDCVLGVSVVAPLLDSVTKAIKAAEAAAYEAGLKEGLSCPGKEIKESYAQGWRECREKAAKIAKEGPPLAIGAMTLILLAGCFWRSHHPLKKPWPPRVTTYHDDCNVVPNIRREGNPGDWTIFVECQP